jgi:hypothetical protein
MVSVKRNHAGIQQMRANTARRSNGQAPKAGKWNSGYEQRTGRKMETEDGDDEDQNIEHRTSNIEHRTSNKGGGGGAVCSGARVLERGLTADRNVRAPRRLFGGPPKSAAGTVAFPGLPKGGTTNPEEGKQGGRFSL